MQLLIRVGDHTTHSPAINSTEGNAPISGVFSFACEKYHSPRVYKPFDLFLATLLFLSVFDTFPNSPAHTHTSAISTV